MKGALQLIYPPQCMGCGETVGQTGALCPACWREADFIGPNCCLTCGAPLPVGADIMGEAIAIQDGSAPLSEAGPRFACDECIAMPRPWRRGCAAMTYRGTGRRLALMLKHGDRLDIATPLGGWVAAAAAPLVQDNMLVVPIPLHPRRLFKRRYNQAELLAQSVARTHGLQLMPHLLSRTRHTPSQDHGHLHQRFTNLEGAFAVPERYRAAISGRPVLLIDDVMASGATITTAANCLLAAGAGPISTAVLARAVKET